jgi:serine phosphatase RsbU (regulator of sigma subunit)
LGDIADHHLTEHFGALRVELLLADYRIAGLWPALRTEHETAGELGSQTVAGRAFASQRPIVEDLPGVGVRALIPVSAWCDRLGVLAIDLPHRPSADQLEALRVVADELAVALSAADRSTDRYRRIRRRQRLTMAAEMQWDLLPGRALGGPQFLLAGQLEPAYAVCGDHFDWALDGQRLTITTLNGDGTGLAAALLTMLAVNGMRNARRSGGSLLEQAELASDAVFTHYAGKHHVATLLLEVDIGTGLVTAIDAGSPVALRMRGHDITQIELDKQLPLGMFAETRYDVQHFQLEAGDRLVIVSDGVHAAAPGGQTAYGTRALAAAVRATRLQPATEAVASVMRGLRDYHGAHDFGDDAVVVCLDWGLSGRSVGMAA